MTFEPKWLLMQKDFWTKMTFGTKILFDHKSNWHKFNLMCFSHHQVEFMSTQLRCERSYLEQQTKYFYFRYNIMWWDIMWNAMLIYMTWTKKNWAETINCFKDLKEDHNGGEFPAKDLLPLPDDSVLHRGGAHPLPDQHHQQGRGQGDWVWRDVLLQEWDFCWCW